MRDGREASLLQSDAIKARLEGDEELLWAQEHLTRAKVPSARAARDVMLLKFVIVTLTHPGLRNQLK